MLKLTYSGQIPPAERLRTRFEKSDRAPDRPRRGYGGYHD
jgi:hypothetical protein